jgi:hypothetical protein
VQRMLNFLDIPIPEMHLWETLAEGPRILAIQVLARLIFQVTVPPQRAEEDHDR